GRNQMKDDELSVSPNSLDTKPAVTVRDDAGAKKP
ncbi:MAG: hypothetical protein RL186_788, partial [Pseudomonadota bacterium]